MARAEELRRGIADLFQTSEYSDLVIACRGKKYNVHKAIICLGSGFFRRACKEGSWKEGGDGVVNLTHDEGDSIPMDDPELVDLMLRHLYGMDYSKRSEDCPIVIHAKMCAIADFYDIEGLKTLAQQKLKSAVEKNWDGPGFVKVVSLVFNPPLEKDWTLQEIIAVTIGKHPSLLKTPGIEAIFNEKPNLAVALFYYLLA